MIISDKKLQKRTGRQDPGPLPHVCSSCLLRSCLPAIDSKIFTDYGCLRRFLQVRTDSVCPLTPSNAGRTSDVPIAWVLDLAL